MALVLVLALVLVVLVLVLVLVTTLVLLESPAPVLLEQAAGLTLGLLHVGSRLQKSLVETCLEGLKQWGVQSLNSKCGRETRRGIEFELLGWNLSSFSDHARRHPCLGTRCGMINISGLE